MGCQHCPADQIGNLDSHAQQLHVLGITCITPVADSVKVAIRASSLAPGVERAARDSQRPRYGGRRWLRRVRPFHSSGQSSALLACFGLEGRSISFRHQLRHVARQSDFRPLAPGTANQWSRNFAATFSRLLVIPISIASWRSSSVRCQSSGMRVPVFFRFGAFPPLRCERGDATATPPSDLFFGEDEELSSTWLNTFVPPC